MSLQAQEHQEREPSAKARRQRTVKCFSGPQHSHCTQHSTHSTVVATACTGPAKDCNCQGAITDWEGVQGALSLPDKQLVGMDSDRKAVIV